MPLRYFSLEFSNALDSYFILGYEIGFVVNVLIKKNIKFTVLFFIVEKHSSRYSTGFHKTSPWTTGTS